MPRKRKWIDRKLLKELCLSQCSNEEIAGALRVSWDTLQRRYAEAIKVWRGQGPMSARRRLYTLAMREDDVYDKEGDVIGTKPASVSSLIFYLKNYGGMADVVADRSADFGDLPRTGFQAGPDEARKPN